MDWLFDTVVVKPDVPPKLLNPSNAVTLWLAVLEKFNVEETARPNTKLPFAVALIVPAVVPTFSALKIDVTVPA